MPTYVTLLNWTDQGIKNFRQSTERAKDFTELVAASGGKVRELGLYGGRGNGGTINVVIKSGTDHYHGDVFEFLRNTALDARNDFNIVKPGPAGEKAPLRQNEFGVTFGGPVFYKQANPKTFFFADYAGKRFAQGQTDVGSVPVVNVKSRRGL